MAVYTVLDHATLQDFITPYGIGDLVSFSGAPDGIENTTYFIETDAKHAANQFVLTVFETIDESYLANCLNITQQLADQQLPVAKSLQTMDGKTIQTLCNKPAALFIKAEGSHPLAPTIEQCKAIGSTLANMHNYTKNICLTNHSARDLQWISVHGEQLLPFLNNSDQQLLSNCLDELNTFNNANHSLQQGVIHSDLFRDNTLFNNNELTAIIDFYSAYTGYLLLDLAIVVNDWCTDNNGNIHLAHYQAILSAYQNIRPFSKDEQQHWQTLHLIAALRFWVSRLLAQHEKPIDTKTLISYKDPATYKNIILKLAKN